MKPLYLDTCYMELLGGFSKWSYERCALRLFQAFPHATRLHHARATAPHASKRVASAVSRKNTTVLLRMRRSKVDVVRVQAAVGAVRRGAILDTELLEKRTLFL